MLLYLGGQRLARAAHSLARFGVWSLRTGDDASGLDDTRFFLDIYGDQVVSAIALSVATELSTPVRPDRGEGLLQRPTELLASQLQPAVLVGGDVRDADAARDQRTWLGSLRPQTRRSLRRTRHHAYAPNPHERGCGSLVGDPEPETAGGIGPAKRSRTTGAYATRVGKSPSLADSAKPDLSDFRLHESARQGTTPRIRS